MEVGMGENSTYVVWDEKPKIEQTIKNCLVKGIALFEERNGEWVVQGKHDLEINIYCETLTELISIANIDNEKESRWLFFR